MIDFTSFNAMDLWKQRKVDIILRAIHRHYVPGGLYNHMSNYDAYQMLLKTTAGEIAALPRDDMKFMLRRIKELSK